VTYHYHMLMLNIFNTNGDIFATHLKIDQKYEKFDYAKGVINTHIFVEYEQKRHKNRIRVQNIPVLCDI
jgi:hypothetical protein